ncbi:MAG: hypothetical protein JO157_15910 [Acetobacteraceae bacterium]|nr:hypothetical protein [Acetobacteraceae bacterium]
MEIDDLQRALDAMEPEVERHITRERVRRYLAALVDAPAPSTAARAMRLPVLRRLLREDGVLGDGTLHLEADYGRSGSPVLLTGAPAPVKPLWYFAHLDTISYLIQPEQGGRHALVPFCYHLFQDGVRPARAYRYDLAANAYVIIADGELESVADTPFFRPRCGAPPLRPGDRVVPFAPYEEDPDTGVFTGHMDNGGGVAALAVAAPVLARLGVEAMLAFPDEEEGPPGAGSQVMGRGSSRIVSLLPAPDLAIVADVQQAGGGSDADTHGGVENSTRLGAGAVLAEFSSLARGAVTPPDLLALAYHVSAQLKARGVRIQESNNAYNSRSDDVSVLLKTPDILLLGFPGFNRHFDLGPPRAHLDDVMHLAKALSYMSVVRPWLVERRLALLEGSP